MDRDRTVEKGHVRGGGFLGLEKQRVLGFEKQLAGCQPAAGLSLAEGGGGVFVCPLG